MSSNVSWNLLGCVAYAFGQWLQLIILAHVGGASAVGTYAFALAFTAPVMVFASLCLRVMQASDARDTYTFREYLSLRRATTLGAILAIVVIAGMTGTARAGWAVLLPVCAMRAVDALSDCYYGLWQRHERMRIIACGLMLNATGSVVLMIAAAMLGGGVPGAAVGAAIGSFAALLFIRHRTWSDPELRRAVRSNAGPIDWRRVFNLSRETAPLGLTVLLGSLQQNIPRYFVQGYAGAAALGVFAAASQLTATADLVGGALAAAAAPRLGAYHASGDRWSFRKVTRHLVLTGILLGALGVAVSAITGRWFLVHVYNPEFATGALTLVILSAAAGMTLIASLLGYALTSARVIAIQPPLLALTLTVLAACSVAIVPRWGAEGAAAALLAATSVHALGSFLVLRRADLHPTKARGLNPALT